MKYTRRYHFNRKRRKGTIMDKKLTPELKELKQEFDFLHKKIGDLEWELATIFYGKKAILNGEADELHERLDNYRANMEILIEKVKKEISKANHSKN